MAPKLPIVGLSLWRRRGGRPLVVFALAIVLGASSYERRLWGRLSSVFVALGMEASHHAPLEAFTASKRIGGVRQPTRRNAPAVRWSAVSRSARGAGSEGDFSQLTVAELKEQLRVNGLPVSGNKAALIARLEAQVVDDDKVPAPEEQEAAEVEKEDEEEVGKDEEETYEAVVEVNVKKQHDKKAPMSPPLPPWQQPFDLALLGNLAKKEQSVFRFVKRHAGPGDLPAVLVAIERFAHEHSWLKVAGEGKSRIFQGTMRAGDRVVEMGTFVGFSSMLMAKRLRDMGGGGHVTSCEVDAATAMVARAIIEYAGATAEVRVRVGRGGDWIATGQLGVIDMLVLDHRGTKYHEDLLSTEPDLAAFGARVLADNVLYPGAPLFLNTLRDRYNVTFHEVKEFLRPDLDDWITVSEPPLPPPNASWKAEVDPAPDGGWGPRPMARRPGMTPPGPAPPELRQWSAEVDAICWRSIHEDVDWLGFQAHIGPKLRAWKDKYIA